MQAFAAAVEQQVLRQSAALQQLPRAIKARRQAEQLSLPMPDTKPEMRGVAMTVLEVVLHTQQLQVWLPNLIPNSMHFLLLIHICAHLLCIC